MIATFRQTGGARLGRMNASWPLARFSANEDALRLSCLGVEHVFPRSSIVRLSRHRGLLSSGLRIEHRGCPAPAFVVFWTSLFFGPSRFAALRSKLEPLGYHVED